MSLEMREIGKIKVDEKGQYIELNEQYLLGLKEIEGFSHLIIIWWASWFEGEAYRTILESEKPYKNAPDVIGIFATRSPIRPNPIMITAATLLEIEGSKIRLAYIDAEPETPVLDIKPYYPCSDFVTTAVVPKWSSNWPKSLEESATFDWGSVFENAH